MSDQQLYLAAGLPTVVALIGIMVNVSYFVVIIARIDALITQMDVRNNGLEQSWYGSKNG